MNKTDFAYPRDALADEMLDFYRRLDPQAVVAAPPDTAGDRWHCRIQTLRGPRLAKAGCSVMHVVNGRIYDRPGDLKLFETIAYPADPRVPGFVFLVNINRTEGAGCMMVLYTDIFFQDGERDSAAADILSAAVRGVYDAAGRNPDTRYKAKPGRIMAGLGSEQGVMEFLDEGDTAFADALFAAVLPAYAQILAPSAAHASPPAGTAELFHHRARLVEWLTIEDVGIRFARESGVPLQLIESYGYPPVVCY